MSSCESEFYCILRGAACALQVRELLKEIGMGVVARVLTDSDAARGVVRRTGSGRVKHLEARWLWVQECVRSGDIVIGCVDTSLNTSDLGNMLLTAKRFLELLAMMPLRLGVGLLAIGGADALDQHDGEGDGYFYPFVAVLSLSLMLAAFGIGWVIGRTLATAQSAADHEKKGVATDAGGSKKTSELAGV